MRKWMAERLKRRKKKAETAPDESKATPLQPAYFDAEPNAAPEEAAEPVAARDPEPIEAEPEEASEPVEAQGNSQPSQGERNFNRGNSQQRRRRRGGRGRGRTSQQSAARDAAQQAPAEAAPVA